MHNVSGLIFDPYDVKELSLFMQIIENKDKNEIKKMIEIANLNLENYNLNSFSINLKKAINEAIKKPRYSIFSQFLLRIISLI